MNKTAVLLINLGTPDVPTEPSIRSYLKEFLSDPRVVDYPRWLWLPILNWIILRTRPPKLVEKYELVWGSKDGPIRNITQALARRLQQLEPELTVVSAMTYGNPSVTDTLDELKDHSRIIVIPLFPQYAGATTGAVRDVLQNALASRRKEWQIDFQEDYFSHPDYIHALADSVEKSHAYRTQSPHVVFSFHGIPQSQAKHNNYEQQCQTTAAQTAAQLGLPSDRWTVTFQSRFGPLPWLKPYTDVTLSGFPDRGIKDALVVCPGFAVDCLETIEEIKVLNRNIFIQAGGVTFNYVKALNASWQHATVFQKLIGEIRQQDSHS